MKARKNSNLKGSQPIFMDIDDYIKAYNHKLKTARKNIVDTLPPFNLDKHSYIDMFNMLSGPLYIYLTFPCLPFTDSYDHREVKEEALIFQRRICDDDNKITHKYLTSDPLITLFDSMFINLDHCLIFNFGRNPTIRNWCHNKVYPQISFVHSGRGHNYRWREEETSVSMIGYDQMVVKSQSIEPIDHNPSDIDIPKKYYMENVEDYYKVGCAIMSRNLITFRNKMLVMFKAHLLGRNPFYEWDRFEKAGGWYFLQYPELCQ